MKFIIVSLLLFLFNHIGFSQNDCEYAKNGKTLKSNHMSVRINTDGTLFHQNGEGHFINPDFGPGSTGTIRKAGLWLGGFENGTDVLKVAAASIASDNDNSDFYPGPITPDQGIVYANIPCNYMNQVWHVTREEILSHLKDYYEDELIDDPIPSIIHWPGNGNPYFWWGSDELGLPDTRNGWAPFFDRNHDGIYDPKDGDYPGIGIKGGIPNEIFWTVYNDEGGGSIHQNSFGDAIRAEVQFTAYTMECPDNLWVEDFLFTEYKIINQALTDLDSVYAGIWVDFDLGCPSDDYFGSLPNKGAFYAYNKDDIDGNEEGECIDDIETYKDSPVMSVIFPGFDKFSNFTYYEEGDSVEIVKSAPENAVEIYNYLTGTWKDGTPYSYGGDGYDPTYLNPLASHAFPDKPSDLNGWSMQSENIELSRSYALGSVRPFYEISKGRLVRGGAYRLHVIYGFHQANTMKPIEVVDRISNWEIPESVHALSTFHSFTHADLCDCPKTIGGNDIEEEDPYAPPSFKIFPNPTSGKITINYTGENMYELAIFNTNKELVYFDDTIEEKEEIKLDLSHLLEGLYFIRATVNGTVFEEKLVVN